MCRIGKIKDNGAGIGEESLATQQPACDNTLDLGLPHT